MTDLSSRRVASLSLVVSAAWALGSCAVGPPYVRPAAVTPPAFKEALPPGATEADLAAWKQSAPGDAYEKGRWWELYNDPALDALEEQVGVSNQNVQQAEAQYREAEAAIGVAHAQLAPTITTSPSITMSSGRGTSTVDAATGATTGGTTSAATGTPAGTSAVYSLPLDASWEPDLWGSLRRGVSANVATAESMAAAVANARLLYQAELAEDYFGLHGVDAQVELLTRTEASFEDYLTLTQNRFAAGVASGLDVAQAQTQLDDTQSQLLDFGVQRAAFEHAIAILIGKAPSDVTIPVVAISTPPPRIPLIVPSELLERRPDIASAERRVAAANEQIGIAKAAFFPNLTLTGTAGLESSTLTKLFTWPSRFWSVGPQLAATLFDGGRRRSVVAEQVAAYDATVADYRQTVLTALQQVEDNMAALRILSDEADKAQQTVQAATEALNIASAQYRAGTVSYLAVITSQAAMLSANVTATSLGTRRLTASVLLIEALGGGWTVRTP